MSDQTTEGLIEISRSMLLNDSENATSPHEWRLCKRLETQAQEIKNLKLNSKRWSEELDNKDRFLITRNVELVEETKTLTARVKELEEIIDQLKNDSESDNPWHYFYKTEVKENRKLQTRIKKYEKVLKDIDTYLDIDPKDVTVKSYLIMVSVMNTISQALSTESDQS